MEKEKKDRISQVEEITDLQDEIVIDISDDELTIDVEDESTTSAEFEEITGLQDVSSNIVIIEDENPPEVSTVFPSDDIITLTEKVDSVNKIKNIAHKGFATGLSSEIDMDNTIFKDIPEPLGNSFTEPNRKRVTDSYVDVTIDEENREIKGKIYFDESIDALIIEDIAHDEGKEQFNEKKSEIKDTPKNAPKKPLKTESDNINPGVVTDNSTKAEKTESSNVLTIEIPPEVKDKIELYDIDNFNFINLDEAEKIATEDILILSEEDLIEELEEIDLIPVETTQTKESKREKKNDVKNPVTEKTVAVDKPQKPIHRGNVEEMFSEDTGAEYSAKDNYVEVVEIKEIEDNAIPQDINKKSEDSVAAIYKKDITTDEDSTLVANSEGIEKSTEQLSVGDSSLETTMPHAYHHTPELANTTYTFLSPAEKIEVLPDNIASSTTKNPHLFIIDDVGVAAETRKDDRIFIDDIDKIISGMVEITEGDMISLKEASSQDEEKYIAPIITGTLPTFQDKMVDFEEEYKFKDDDIVFVDNAVILDEYEKYLKVIDDYYETKKVKKSSATVELFGLTNEELSFFYDVLFEKEYETIKASEAFNNITIGRDFPEKDAGLEKRFKYIQTMPQSLSQKEKQSIEENIESPMAVVIEESVDDIIKRLKKIKPNINIDGLIKGVSDKVRSSYDDKVIIEQHNTSDNDTHIENITDKVVILDNRDDVDRFIESMPQEKQESIRKLLKYLDSLFDKLPEEVIKNFANSEYFDLYVKVLKELGV